MKTGLLEYIKNSGHYSQFWLCLYYQLYMGVCELFTHILQSRFTGSRAKVWFIMVYFIGIFLMINRCLWCNHMPVPVPMKKLRSVVVTSHKHHRYCFSNYNTKANISIQRRHNGRDGVSNHRPHDCLFNRIFRRKSKKTSKLCVTGLFAGNSPVTG